MDDSKFNLWRGTFSFCFIDGFLSPEETAFIEEKLKALPFNETQRKTLMTDLKSPPDIDKLLPLITRPADRGFLINNIRFLSRIDNLTSAEKHTIHALQEKVLSKVNLNELSDIIAADEKAQYAEMKEHTINNKNSYSETIIKKLMQTIDGR